MILKQDAGDWGPYRGAASHTGLQRLHFFYSGCSAVTGEAARITVKALCIRMCNTRVGNIQDCEEFMPVIQHFVQAESHWG